MASVDPKFSTLMGDMQLLADNNAKYLMATGNYQRKWMVPSDAPATWDPLDDITDHGTLFDRATVNQQYADTHNGTDSSAVVADTMGYSIQLNYMAMMERAFRDRHKSVVRSTAHDCGRKRAHGEQLGIHKGSVLEAVSNMFTAEVQGT